MALDDHQPIVARGAHTSRSPNERQVRSAFTLIELLVVIAIIAILAAILFPVFAQAKLAAKVNVSLQNIKQQSLSILMYATDYDDNFVIGGQWHSADLDAAKYYPNSWYMPWTGLVDAYLKNKDILASPLRGPVLPFTDVAMNGCSNDRQCKLLYPTYGYNAMYLSPSDRLTGLMTACSTTAVAKSAEQVMLTEIWHRGTTKWRAFTVAQDYAYNSFASAEPPDAVTVYASRYKPFGEVGWGTYNHAFMAGLNLTEEEGLDTGGVSFRCPGLKTPTAFADGHVKVVSVGYLAQGTDWVRGSTYVAKNLVNGKYLWDPRGD